MTDTNELDGSRAGVPLPDVGGQGEQPEEIIYARYTYDGRRPTGRRVRGEKLSYVVQSTDIADFVRSRVDSLGLPNHVQTRQPHAQDDAREREINIYVGKPCWVVIELEGDLQFAPGGPGITVEPGHGDDNCDLVHVPPNGPPSEPGLAGTGCRLLYFRVQRRGRYQRQKFHLHLVRGNKRLDDPEQVDPDIPNDGGKFPYPFIESDVREGRE
jgi:hypothetical protein